MIKIQTTEQILPFKSGMALPSPSQAPGQLNLSHFPHHSKDL